MKENKLDKIQSLSDQMKCLMIAITGAIDWGDISYLFSKKAQCSLLFTTQHVSQWSHPRGWV